jgi:2,5-diketo-D-gluconate reductase A
MTGGDPRLPLCDGGSIPQLGLGVWQLPAEETARITGDAIAAGYRLIDTARVYRNEEGVGQAVRASGLPRDELYVTTKLANMDQGYDQTLRAFDESLKRLGLDHVDLYLIHWPMPIAGRYMDTWRALMRLKEQGLTRSIGVSNFMQAHLRRVMDETGMTPVLNQIELHPRFQQRALRDFHADHGIVTQSYSPLGRGYITGHPVLSGIGAAHGRSWAQVVIRWHVQNGLAVIPRSADAGRLRENRAVFDFTLSPEEMAAIAALDDPKGRDGGDPEVTTFDFGPPGIRHAKRLLRRARHRLGI